VAGVGARRPPFEPLVEVEGGGAVEVALALAEARGLVARLGGGVVTLDSLVALAARGGLEGVGPERLAEPLPSLGRVGAARALSLYASLGRKYALAGGAALTPRSVYAAVRLHPSELAEVDAGPPAVVAPNATLRGALLRMAGRGSICAFVVRAGRLRGVVDAWTALRVAAEEGREGLEASCASLASTEPLGQPSDLPLLLSRYGFAACPGPRPALIDDVALHRALLALAPRWLRG